MVLTHPLVIVSFDALGAEDVAQHLDMMPNLAQLIQRGAHVKKWKAFINFDLSIAYVNYDRCLSSKAWYC